MDNDLFQTTEFSFLHLKFRILSEVEGKVCRGEE